MKSLLHSFRSSYWEERVEQSIKWRGWTLYHQKTTGLRSKRKYESWLMKLEGYWSLDGAEPCEGLEFGDQSKLEVYRTHLEFSRHKNELLFLCTLENPPECQGDVGILQNLPTILHLQVWMVCRIHSSPLGSHCAAPGRACQTDTHGASHTARRISRGGHPV